MTHGFCPWREEVPILPCRKGESYIIIISRICAGYPNTLISMLYFPSYNLILVRLVYIFHLSNGKLYADSQLVGCVMQYQPDVCRLLHFLSQNRVQALSNLRGPSCLSSYFKTSCVRMGECCLNIWNEGFRFYLFSVVQKQIKSSILL